MKARHSVRALVLLVIWAFNVAASVSQTPATAPVLSTGDYDYRIGPDDLIEVKVFEVPELGGEARVSATGTISLPLLGVVRVSGVSPVELARTVEILLREKYLKDPHVTVSIKEYASQPVSVVGSVKAPGIYQIKGRKLLLEMLASAQGLDSDYGRIIQIMRKPTGAGETEPRIIEIAVEDLLQKGKAELNVPILPNDVINVLRAGSVFVVGEVNQPGEFVMKNGKDITVMQAIAKGGGLTREAKKDNCTIIRYFTDGSKQEVRLDVSKIMEGSGPDLPLTTNDILFVPSNGKKRMLNRALDSVISVAIGRAIYVR